MPIIYLPIITETFKANKQEYRLVKCSKPDNAKHEVLWIEGGSKIKGSSLVFSHIENILNTVYYINTCEIPGFLLLLKNQIFIARSEYTIFISHM